MPRKKPTRYTVAELLTEYNQALYDEVATQITIRLQPQAGTWSAHIEADGTAVVGYCRSDYPDACFAHELLHIKAELAGLKDPYVRSNDATVTAATVRFFINQLAHHKFYQEFYELGFAEDEFLHDNDVLEVQHVLRRDVPKIEALYEQSKKPLDGFAILMPYLVCVSPHETSPIILAYKNRLIAVAKPEFIQAIDTILAEWATSPVFDYCLPLAKLCKACHKFAVSFAPANNPSQQVFPAAV